MATRRVTYWIEDGDWTTMARLEEVIEDQGELVELGLTLWTASGALRALQEQQRWTPQAPVQRALWPQPTLFGSADGPPVSGS